MDREIIHKRLLSRGFAALIVFLMVLLPGVPCSWANYCQSDLNDDGSVNVEDSLIMKAEAGRVNCKTQPCKSDFNGDGKVNDKDQKIMQAEFGRNDCLTGTGAEGDEGGFGETDKEDTLERRPLSSRFKDNRDGTVTDSETGLMWAKDANLPGDTLLFHRAFDYIEEMNEGTHPNFGYSDWRLPTMEELRSLIDYTNFTSEGHVIVAGNPFNNVQSLKFHSSMAVSYLRSSQYNWFVSLYCRLVGHNVNSCFGYVWPVRGGD